MTEQLGHGVDLPGDVREFRRNRRGYLTDIEVSRSSLILEESSGRTIYTEVFERDE